MGVGFGRHHGFPTSYCDFGNILSTYNSSKILKYIARRNISPEDIDDKCSVIKSEILLREKHEQPNRC